MERNSTMEKSKTATRTKEPEPRVPSKEQVWEGIATGLAESLSRIYTDSIVADRVDEKLKATIIDQLQEYENFKYRCNSNENPVEDVKEWSVDDESDNIERVFNFLVDLHETKAQMYGPSWKSSGEIGAFHNVERKFDRIKRWVNEKADDHAEPIVTTVGDLTLYCLLWLSECPKWHPEQYKMWVEECGQ
jgi:hypothetical protein